MNYILYLLFTTLLPVLLGSLLVPEDDGTPYLVISRWCAGFTFMMALIYLPALAGIFFSWSLMQLTIIWFALVGFLSAAALILLVKRRDNMAASAFSMIRSGNFFELAAFLLPAAHAVYTFFMMHVDDDDVAYVGAVTTAVDTNTLMKYDAVNGNLITDFARNEMNRLVTSPQFAFYAVISKTFQIRPAVLCHTFLPPVLTMLFYAAFLLVGRELYRDDRKKAAIFTILVFLINMSSYFSVYTAGTFLMIRSWQGKAQITGLVFPLLFAFALRVLRRGEMAARDTMYLTVLLAAACLMTSMGAVFVLMAASLLLALIAVIRKNAGILLRALPACVIPAVMLAVYFFIV